MGALFRASSSVLRSRTSAVSCVSSVSFRTGTRSPLDLYSFHPTATTLSSVSGIRKLSTSLRHASPYPSSVYLTPYGTLDVTLPESAGGGEVELHSLWLRDHCRCEKCFHAVTKQRLFDTFKLDSTVQWTETTRDGLKVTWKEAHAGTSEHISLYPWEFVKSAGGPSPFEPTSDGASGLTPRGKQYWTSDIAKAPPTVHYDAVMNDEGAVLQWLENVNKYGFCFVKGIPPTPEDTERLIERIAFIRVTHYGGFWDFTADLAHGDTAYTNLALKAHTDNTYFSDPCGLQIFHILSHTEGSGGQSLLVDGFRAAAEVGRTNPSHLQTLASTKIPAHAVGDAEYHYVIPESQGKPIVGLDASGSEPVFVSYNNDDRGTIRSKTPKELDEWYAALKHWDQVLTAPESEYWFQLEPGTVVVIDNHRVLHGRAAFTGKRRMCGAYIGADDYLARLRALRAATTTGTSSSTGGKPGQRAEIAWRL